MPNTTTVRHTSITCGDCNGGSLPAPRRGARWRWSAPHCTQSETGSSSEASGSRMMLSGRVAAVRGDTLVVLREPGGSRTTVLETASTSYTTLGRIHTAALGAHAVHAGDFVGVRGVGNADGTVTATSVTVFVDPPFG